METSSVSAFGRDVAVGGGRVGDEMTGWVVPGFGISTGAMLAGAGVAGPA